MATRAFVPDQPSHGRLPRGTRFDRPAFSIHVDKIPIHNGTRAGAVTLEKYVHKLRERDLHVSYGRRIRGDIGQFTPRREAYSEVFAIKRSAQQIPLQGKVLADRPEALEESLSACRAAKSSHASLAFAGRLMTVLGTVVHAGSSLHEHVPDVAEFGNIGLGSRITA